MIRQRLLLRSLRAIGISSWLSCIAASNGAAAPPGINLSWNDCGTFGQQDRVFACDTNVGVHTLVGSFSSPVALDSLNGNEVLIEYQTSNPTQMSPWWQIKTPTDASAACRSTALTVDFSFLANTNCADYWAGNAAGGVGIIRNTTQANRARIIAVCAIPQELSVPLEAELETYSFKLNISNIKTVGAGACTGCMNQTDIVLTSIRLTQSFADGINRDVLLTQPSTRNYVYWRPGVVATRNITWGAIKSMYR